MSPIEGAPSAGDSGVSVVIPTVGRPGLVTRALQSALDQTIPPTEVVVVIDGPDASTAAALSRIDDRRLVVVQLAQRGGAGPARNAGVARARGYWVAFLDDDDEWMPTKLEVQLATARASQSHWPIVACRFQLENAAGKRILPERDPRPGEPIGEYLFVRHGWFWGVAAVLTTTILTRRDLVRQIPFAPMLRREDLDWLLRACEAGAALEFVSCRAPLAIWRPSGPSQAPDIETDLAWADRSRSGLTPRGYAGYLLHWRGAIAARSADYKLFWPLLRRACRYGRPSWWDVMVYFGLWLLPTFVRLRAAGWLRRWRSSRSRAPAD